MRDTLSHCEPWAEHLTAKGIKELGKACTKGDAALAREVIDQNQLETAAPWCIEMLKTACVIVCAKCPRITIFSSADNNKSTVISDFSKV